jgi:hypothetical protein
VVEEEPVSSKPESASEILLQARVEIDAIFHVVGLVKEPCALPKP